jgi:hypothetical protein
MDRCNPRHDENVATGENGDVFRELERQARRARERASVERARVLEFSDDDGASPSACCAAAAAEDVALEAERAEQAAQEQLDGHLRKVGGNH